ncbi:MAG: hypothetical protein IT209_03665 [Armatimonadetes bacterium]|nr:hypothetical protein [Armatimonadota bacterium]
MYILTGSQTFVGFNGARGQSGFKAHCLFTKAVFVEEAGLLCGRPDRKVYTGKRDGKSMIKARALVILMATVASVAMLAIGTILALTEAHVLPLGQQRQVQAVAPMTSPTSSAPAADELIKSSKPATADAADVDYQH